MFLPVGPSLHCMRRARKNAKSERCPRLAFIQGGHFYKLQSGMFDWNRTQCTPSPNWVPKSTHAHQDMCQEWSWRVALGQSSLMQQRCNSLSFRQMPYIHTQFNTNSCERNVFLGMTHSENDSENLLDSDKPPEFHVQGILVIGWIMLKFWGSINFEKLLDSPRIF